MTRAEVLDLYYRTLDWKEIYYEAQAKMDEKKRLRPPSIESYEKYLPNFTTN